jgi:hypothetical protein
MYNGKNTNVSSDTFFCKKRHALAASPKCASGTEAAPLCGGLFAKKSPAPSRRTLHYRAGSPRKSNGEAVKCARDDVVTVCGRTRPTPQRRPRLSTRHRMTTHVVTQKRTIQFTRHTRIGIGRARADTPRALHTLHVREGGSRREK